MSKSFQFISDQYERRARLYPALFASSPGIGILIAFLGVDHATFSIIVTVLASCGFFYSLAHVSRDRGKRMQERIFGDSLPTTVLLRHSDSQIDNLTKGRYHKLLSKAIGQKFPSSAQEQRDPKSADMIYGSAVRWLKEQTRDRTKFKILSDELMAYGFRRNLYGLRPFGLVLALICLAGSLSFSGTLSFEAPFIANEAATIKGPFILAGTYSVIVFFLWLIRFDESAVREAGFSYAQALLRSCDSPEKIGAK